MVRRAELERRGIEGFSDEDLEEAIRRGLAWREDVQAHEVGLRKMIEEAATRRTGMRETGAGERLATTLEAERPGREAETRRLGAVTGLRGAEAEALRYRTGLERELEPRVRSLLEQAQTKGELDIKALEREEEMARPREAAPAVPEPEATVARPTRRRRRLRPSVRRFFTGTPTERVPGVIPGILSPVTGWTNIGEWLRHGIRRGYEWARPYER